MVHRQELRFSACSAPTSRNWSSNTLSGRASPATKMFLTDTCTAHAMGFCHSPHKSGVLAWVLLGVALLEAMSTQMPELNPGNETSHSETI